jgi:hypothetical protein
MTETNGMTLDDEIDSTAAPTTPKDVDGIPYCTVHHCRMKQSSGGKKDSPTVYYKCPVKGCKAEAKCVKTRQEGVVPPQPLPCPRCSKSNNDIYCERDDKVSTAGRVILKCPDCGWKSNALVDPRLAAAQLSHRERKVEATAAGVGDR